jgi:RNA polymerase sigma-70 factor (ECF subfamily)
VTESDFAAAYREHRPRIVDYLRRRTGDAALAEDLAQDVFLAALVAQPRLAHGSVPLLGWLYMVARRRAIDAGRRARRAPDPAVAVPSGDEEVPSARAIASAIEALPEDQQRLVLLRLIGGRSFSEIATTLGADAAVCRVRFSRALRTLRESLDQRVFVFVVLVAEWADDAVACCV